MGRIVRAVLLSLVVGQRLASFLARPSSDDLRALTELVEPGVVSPVIDRIYPLVETAEAIGYLETGRARGKVVITV
jgi:NADPH:quinone reductase-like Zn-dependent oxidoreductase